MTTVLLIGQLEALDGGIADFLREDGIDVFRTDDSQSGIAEGLQQDPRLAFVEVDSPAKDHFEVLAQLRQEGVPSFRIVAVCNRYSSHVNELCTALGADFTIPQTDDRSNLVLLIRGLMVLSPGGRGSNHSTRGNTTSEPIWSSGTQKTVDAASPFC